MITINNLHKKFGRRTVLDGIDLDINKKGIIAILGPNGSGKTTLIKCLLGMVIPNSGKIFFNDKSILGEWDYRKDISYMPQIARFPQNLKVIELLKMIKNLRSGAIRDAELISIFKLEEFLDKKLRST